VWKGELINKKKNGEYYWEFTTISPIKSRDGNTTHYVAVKEDVTSRKQMENELRFAKEIAEDAQRASESANQAKSQFLANMSHELRTPLNGILGYAQILKQANDLNNSQRKGVDIIERSGKHLLNLINDILDLSKIEAQKIELTETPIQLSAFLDELGAIIRIQAEKKGLAFHLDRASDLPAAIRADEKRLSQIVLNLLSNAVKFTEQGSVKLRIANCELRIDQSEIRNPKSEINQSEIRNLKFEISDTGVGIAESDLESIFSAFTQAGKHSRAIEGTGLGLAISRELVRLMGGELQVESTVGQGSTFWFELAFPEVSEQTISRKTEEKRVIGFSRIALDNRAQVPKILVVDDKLENRALLASLLYSLGFVVREATNGRDGLEQAEEFSPDLIFMDLIMPVMDGFEAVRHIRKSPMLSHIKVIAVSASTQISPEQVRSEFGCDDYIPKPLEIQKVLETLARHLELEWMYEDHPVHALPEEQEEQQKAGETLVMPPHPDLILLYNLTRDGDFNRLRHHLDQLEQMDPQYFAFVRHIRQLAKNLDEEAICRFLKHAIGEDV
jgi:signal transduction histidine kinase/DNA-binding NarL/FixJ family response regulator